MTASALFDLSTEAVAWQRIVRERRMHDNPRPAGASMAGYSVEAVGKVAASALIGKYEWLGNIGRSGHFFGLMSPCRDLEGVVCFGHGPQGTIRNIIGSPALCLERGACVHYAPPNAASFLISRACKLAYRLTGVEIFFAYADPMAGEYGAVYQAANWVYLGQGLYGGQERRTRMFVLAPGRDPDDPANWQTTRALRREHRLTFAKARDLGWNISMRDAKHVYTTNIGKGKKKWLKEIRARAYPSPRPHLKRAIRNSHKIVVGSLHA